MELRQYQIEGVDRLCEMLNERGSALLADEMGLGKTVQAIITAKELDCETIVIVCPASLQLNWLDELMKWSFNYEYHQIVSYEWATKHHANRVDKVDMLILDEAHYCKNRTAQRTKACLTHLWNKAHNKLLLTGTPCPNGLMDGWSLFNKLDPDNFPNRYSYGWRYCETKTNWFTGQKEFYGCNKAHLPELRRKIDKFMVRRLKKEVLSELPPKTYTQVLLEVPRAKDFKLSARETQDALRAVLSESAATKRRGVGLLKVDAAKDYIKDILLAKDRLILWTYHQDVNAKAVQMLESFDCTPLAITGSTSMKQRHEIIELFQSDTPTKLCLVAQIEAAGVGINLTAADTCIFLELDWVPARMAQAIDRLHRIGQASNVQVIYLVGKDTMDHQIISSLRSKIEAITGVMNGS